MVTSLGVFCCVVIGAETGRIRVNCMSVDTFASSSSYPRDPNSPM